MYLGVDGCPEGWIAIVYSDDGYIDADVYPCFGELWSAYGDRADTILVDVPIGLREDSSEPRPCDTEARRKLSPHRHTSVFPTPVREAVYQESYQEAKAVQERRTEGSLGVQSWGIADKIAELDTFLRKIEPEATGTISEAHPEVCFWALNEEQAMKYSKTGQPAAAFWERISVLQEIDESLLDHLRRASQDLDATVGNDDVVDAFALALTASPRTASLQQLPDPRPETNPGDPTGKLPMEIVYAYRTDRGDEVTHDDQADATSPAE